MQVYFDNKIYLHFYCAYARIILENMKFNSIYCLGGMDMSIMGNLDRPDFRPSKADRKLIAYMKANPEEVPVTAIAELARRVGIAESTVTRFVKKMGYASFHLFKVGFAEEYTQRRNRQIIDCSIAPDEPARITGRKLLDAYCDALDQTLEALPDGLIECCADRMLAAEELFFVGLGNSGFLARDASYKFFRIGLRSESSANSHIMMMKAALSGPGTLFVAISHSGESPEVVETVRLAGENGASLLAITAAPSSSLAQAVDEVLPYAGRETLLETGSVSVKMAQSFILDLLYTQIVKQRADLAAENKQRTALAMRRLR